MNSEPLLIRLRFCLFMLVVGLSNLAACAIVAALNVAAGHFWMLGINVASGIVSAMVVAANVFFVASAAIRHSREGIRIVVLHQ